MKTVDELKRLKAELASYQWTAREVHKDFSVDQRMALLVELLGARPLYAVAE